MGMTDKLVVVKMGDETGTATVSVVGYGLSIINRSPNALVLEVSSIPSQSLSIPVGCSFEEFFPRFTSFTITETAGTDVWSYCVKG
jgi:hypothetical protein